MKKFFVYILLTFSVAVLASEDQVKFKNSEQQALYNELLKELRCPKCQNQNIADSNAVVAQDMRSKTKQLVEQGSNKQDVIDYMVNRYGQFAHYQPPLNIATLMLWLLPLGFIGSAILLLVKRSANRAIDSKMDAKVDEASLDQELNQLLEASNTKSNEEEVK